MEDEYLKHYGVRGMKWGVRRYQPYQKGQNSKGKFVGDSEKKDGIKRRTKLSIKRATFDKTTKKTAIGVDKDGRVTAKRYDIPVKKKKTVLGIEKESREKAKERIARQKAKKDKKEKKKEDKKRNNIPEVKKLSDAELKSRVERLNLERRYNDLSDSGVSTGRLIAEEALGYIGKDIVLPYVKQEGVAMIRTAVNEMRK